MTEKKPLLWVERYATGKFTLHADGGTSYDNKIERALAHPARLRHDSLSSPFREANFWVVQDASTIR